MAVKPDKQAIVAELAQVAARSVSAIAADYRGLPVADLTQLRTQARKNGIHMRVYKNTLAILALKDSAFACMEKALRGPVVLFFSLDDPGSAARLLRDFIKTHENFKICGLALGGELLSADRLKAVASLPSRHEALSRLAAVIKAPVTKFVRTLQEPYAQVVRVFAAVRDQKQK